MLPEAARLQDTGAHSCHDAPFRKTHNLEELGQQCVALDTSLATVAERAAPLTEYAWKFR